MMHGRTTMGHGWGKNSSQFDRTTMLTYYGPVCNPNSWASGLAICSLTQSPINGSFIENLGKGGRPARMSWAWPKFGEYRAKPSLHFVIIF